MPHQKRNELSTSYLKRKLRNQMRQAASKEEVIYEFSTLCYRTDEPR